MSLSKLIKTTLIKEKGAIILYLLNAVFIAVFYYLLSDKAFQIYPLVLTSAFLILYLIYRLFHYQKLYRVLEEAKTSPNYNVEENYEYSDIVSYIVNLHKTYIKKLYGMESEIKERQSILSSLIHNMKTSVSVIGLAAEDGLKMSTEENTIYKDIIEEKSKLEDNLEVSLNMFRIQKFERDYIPEKVNLKELITTAVNAKKKEFIYYKVFPKVDIDKNIYVLTDKKWGKYVAEQIISNAIKYSEKENSKVMINADTSLENKTLLKIKDHGIGIKKEDIGRVFDLFFTGNNGREHQASTGIGLYMCKMISEKLNNKISIESSLGKGTTVTIEYTNADISNLTLMKGIVRKID